MFARQQSHTCCGAAQSCRTQLAWWAQEPLPPLMKEACPLSPPASPEKARTSVSRVESSTMGDRQSPLGSEPAVREAGGRRLGPQARQIQTQPEQRATITAGSTACRPGLQPDALPVLSPRTTRRAVNSAYSCAACRAAKAGQGMSRRRLSSRQGGSSIHCTGA